MSGPKASQSRETGNIDETTPLLAASNGAPPESADTEATSQAVSKVASDSKDDQPLPKLQIFLLCYARVIEPIVFFAIFPFISQMVQENGNLKESDIGFYSGLIESLFSITQMMVMIIWGRISESKGRKPVLVISLLGISITAGLFGFSKTIWQMILFRCLAGLFSGNMLTVRTMITELSTKKTQAQAFSYFAFSGNLGIFLGPLIGGLFANPAAQYGGIFSRVEFFSKFPYALSTIVTGILGIAAALVAFLFINETKTTWKSDDEQSNRPPVLSTREVLKSPGVATVLYLNGHSVLLGFAYSAVTPVFWYTRPALGGFGFSSLYQSVFMALLGMSQSIWLLVVFPRLHKRIGTRGIFNWCGAVYPLIFAPQPLLNLLLRAHDHTATVIFWISFPILLVTTVGVVMVFTAAQLAVNDISPTPEATSTVNALALTIACGIRSFTPWVVTTIFAIGVRSQILWGYLIWVVLMAVAALYGIAVRWLPARAA